MAYNEKIAERVRKALSHLPNVEEKKMFRGIAFMVNGKMCVCVGGDEIMCRIDPFIHESILAKKGCRTMVMKDREYIGFILVNQDGMKTQKDFDFWINLALDFNPLAKATKKRKKLRVKNN